MSNTQEYFEDIIKDSVSVDPAELVVNAVKSKLGDVSENNKAMNIAAYVANCEKLSSCPLEEVFAETKGDYNYAQEVLDGINQIEDAKNKMFRAKEIADNIASIIDDIGDLQYKKSIGQMTSEDYNDTLVDLFDKVFELAQQAPLDDLYTSQLKLGQAILKDGVGVIQEHLSKIKDADKLREAIEAGNWDLVDQLMGYDDLRKNQEMILAYKTWCDQIFGLLGIENPYNDSEMQKLLSENQDYYDDIMEIYKKIKSGMPIGDIMAEIMGLVDSEVNTAAKTKYDPLIFDLDGDGYNVDKKELGANFDLDKNGFAEKINWTKKDGFLCLDLNGNGAIDDGGELFGDQTLLADGTRAKNGFEALAQYDSNGDGVINAGDEIFDSLRIWVDADGNGVSGEGEMKTLAELGITSISLGYENVNAETDTEATIGNAAAFTREDGTTGSVGELWVSSDLFDTEDRLDIEIPDEIAALPDVKSIGNVYSLHNAMALDETGELKALVESFTAEEDADKRMAIAEQILFFICGASDVEAGSRGKYIDARQLAVIEAMLGEKYVGTAGADPHSDAAPMLKSAYQDLLNMYYNELNAQTFIKDYAALLRYTENEDGSKTLNAGLVNFILEYQLANGDENAEKMLTEVARYVQYLDNGGIKGINSFVMNYAAISAEYAAEIVKIMPNGYAADGENPLEGTNNGDFLVGSNNNDELYGYEGNDILIGGKGNDSLYGGKGDDTYIFNLGDGNDVINEKNANTENDRVVFGEGISAENIIFQNISGNMVIRFVGSDDTITITNQFSDSRYRIENFCLSDGTVIDYSKINLLIQSMSAFEADTGMSWTEAAEQPTEEYSDIISQMWVKTA